MKAGMLQVSDVCSETEQGRKDRGCNKRMGTISAPSTLLFVFVVTY